MNPLVAIAIGEGLAALIELYRIHANKPEGWKPSPEDIANLLKLADKTAADYKREAAAALGLPWPSV